MDAPSAAAATLGFDQDVVDARSLALIVASTRVTAPGERRGESSGAALASCLESRIPNVAILRREAAQWLRRNGSMRDVAPALAGRAAPSAEIVYRHLHLVDELAPEVIVIHADVVGCHVDHRALLDAHVASARGATLACVAMPAACAHQFGVVGLGPGDRIVRYVDKPGQPQVLPGDASMSLVSTGVVAFDRDLLVDSLTVDANDRWSTHDLGRDVLPLLIGAGGVSGYVLPHRFVPR